MTGEGSEIIAGWYPDPIDPARLRRWDGQGWTSDVVQANAVEQEPPPQQPASPPAPPASTPPPAIVFSAPEPPREAHQAGQQGGQEAGQPSAPDSGPSWPQAGDSDIPAWANVPGLTLPPDLSSIGVDRGPAVPQPRFDEAPLFTSPPPTEPPPVQPTPVQPAPPAPESAQPQFLPPEPERAAPVPPAEPTATAPTPPPLMQQAADAVPLRRDRTRVPANDGPPAAPYAPPPAGAQYDVPPPPGATYTAPPPEQVQPAAAFDRPAILPVASQPARIEAPLIFARPKEPRLAGATTPSSWLMALLPAFQFGVVYLVFGFLAVQLYPGLQYAILIAPALFGLLFASADRKRLIVSGFAPVPSAIWAIVPPLYLVVRCVTIGARSIPQLVAWLVLQAAAAYGVFVLLHPLLVTVLATLPGGS